MLFLTFLFEGDLFGMGYRTVDLIISDSVRVASFLFQNLSEVLPNNFELVEFLSFYNTQCVNFILT